MHAFSHPANLPVDVTFFGSAAAIQHIRLSPSPSFSWTIHPEISSTLRHKIHSWMQAYAEKHPLPFSLPFEMQALSPFTQKVLHALMQIPFGTTITYRELAALCGQPKAYRAVGSACGRNPFPLLIPCHRVKNQNGLGGFSAGLPIKQALLAFESEV